MSIYEVKKPKRLNAFSVPLFIVLFAVGYFLYWWLPMWWPVFTLTNIMRGICNDAYREMDDEKLMTKLLNDSRRTGLRLTAENFEIERIPWEEGELEAKGQKRSETSDKRGKTCVINFYYTVDSQLPIIGKSVEVNFDREVQGDLSVIQW